MTASKADILKGKTTITSDSDDEIVAGTMADRRTPDSSIGGFNTKYPNIGLHKGFYPQTTKPLNQSESWFTMSPPEGYYTSPGGSYVGLPFSEMAAAVGVDSSKLLSGSTILGVEGKIPNKTNADYYAGDADLHNNTVRLWIKDSGYYIGTVNESGNATGTAAGIMITYEDLKKLLGLTANDFRANKQVLGLTGTFTNDAVLDPQYLLTGYSGYDDGVKKNGTMVNQGAKTSSLNCGGSYTIPKGYHNGSGRITANSLSSQTGATASASHLLSGKTAWVNGSKITGNIASQSGQTIAPLAVQQRVSCSGKYMTGDIVINGFGNAYNPMDPVSCNLKTLTGRTWNLIGAFPKPISDRDILVLYGWKGPGTAIYGDGFISEIFLNTEYDIATANANYATKLKIVNEGGAYKLYIYLTSSSSILYTCRAVMFEKK